MMRLNLNFRPLAALFCLLVACLLPSTIFAQTNRALAKTSAPPLSGNRFLFIVDTSAAMKSTAKDTLQAVDEVIRSSASGQLHRGDTLGLWTFNAQLYPGVLPLQTWVPEDMNEIALRIGGFLKQQRYGRDSSLVAALDGMLTVIKSSDIITIFIISNGQSPMQGTPFDDQINALYMESVKEMKKDRKPVVTVLQAKHGKIIKYTVNALPWPVVIPEVPIPIKTPATAAATPPAVAPEEAAPPAEKPTPTPPPVAPATPAPQPTPPPIAQANPPPAPVLAVNPATVPAPVIREQPPLAPPPVHQPLPPVITQNSAPAPGRNDIAPLPPHLAPAPSIPAPLVANETAAPRPPPLSNPQPTPVPIAKPPVRTNAPVTTTPASPASGNAGNVHTIAAADIRPKILLYGALFMAAVGFALIGLLIHRSRTASGPSLITRTMNNPPKK